MDRGVQAAYGGPHRENPGDRANGPGAWPTLQGSLDMPEPTVSPTNQEPGGAEYQALLDHCTSCRKCRANTATACPEAGRLRRAWSAARRTAREGVA